MESKAKVLVVGALPESLVNFRGDLLKSLKAANYDVTAMAGASSAVARALNEDFGVQFEGFPVDRTGLSPIRDLRTLLALILAFRRLRPNAVLAYTIKPVVYGGLASRVIPGGRFVALITGLGFSFGSGGLVRRLLRRLVTGLYRSALKRCSLVIFQNPDDRAEFVKRKIVSIERTLVVGGSGVNLDHFRAQPLPSGAPVFLMIARLIKSKGIYEYVEAARIIRAQFPQVRFDLVGPVDPSPDGISESVVNEWHMSGVINYLGLVHDVRQTLADCHVYVLPSYREGLPRTVLEAMATARPILTTDAPGCRETVTEFANGRLVRVGDANSLAEAIRWFLENRSRWPQMAEHSLTIVKDRFDVNLVNKAILAALSSPKVTESPGPVSMMREQTLGER